MENLFVAKAIVLLAKPQCFLKKTNVGCVERLHLLGSGCPPRSKSMEELCSNQSREHTYSKVFRKMFVRQDGLGDLLESLTSFTRPVFDLHVHRLGRRVHGLQVLVFDHEGQEDLGAVLSDSAQAWVGGELVLVSVLRCLRSSECEHSVGLTNCIIQRQSSL